MQREYYIYGFVKHAHNFDVEKTFHSVWTQDILRSCPLWCCIFTQNDYSDGNQILNIYGQSCEGKRFTGIPNRLWHRMECCHWILHKELVKDLFDTNLANVPKHLP